MTGESVIIPPSLLKNADKVDVDKGLCFWGTAVGSLLLLRREVEAQDLRKICAVVRPCWTELPVRGDRSDALWVSRETSGRHPGFISLER